MNITREVKSIIPRVKNHRGYDDMITDLTISVDCTDLDTGSVVGYQFFHQFDTEVEYGENNPFILFSEITKEQIDALVENIVDEHKVYESITLMEWAETRFNDIYSQPVHKPFSFQIPMEPVGIGTSPVL